ncbi:hypothetical protein RLO149_c039310 [Roseobacter litoralis Och 149]|uniref:Uncharacterized protein n=1 Tax=Roseobacter litoralis (strain ATCC 49566 / DSM 6996 / JCM 21268 / NBRC 15278 / OCh 149) TaxID=391595 RepID=F7ZDP8_ROSLO|nr:hypothetical protein RLO149_c039310 [Roseobacter litoralis Och 149]
MNQESVNHLLLNIDIPRMSGFLTCTSLLDLAGLYARSFFVWSAGRTPLKRKHDPSRLGMVPAARSV